jgi:hypothetical protein
MRVQRRRWVLAIVAVAATDVAILLGAGAVLAASSQAHASVTALVGAMLGDVAALIPQGVADGLGAILGVLGAGWWQQHLLGPALANGSAAGVPALGGVLAAPVYTLVRRRARSPKTHPSATPGPPPHRIYVPVARVLEPGMSASTAAHESAPGFPA